VEKVLCVDDDPHILDAYRRQLRREFKIDTATSADLALTALQSQGPYAVIVSDMRMPGMDGVQFLAKVKSLSPDTVRIMLTGNSDQHTAMEAVNEGSIFRFLTKPCPSEQLAKAILAGLHQYRLIRAEKELLEKTLRGSVKVLVDVLSLVNPTAFGRASRVYRLVRQLATELKIPPSWELDVAAMLSQIGCVTIPPDTMEAVYLGRTLTPEESKMFQAHPSVGRDIVAKIPRLENVAQIIGYQEKCFDGTGAPADAKQGRAIPLGARILKVALDFDALKSSGMDEYEAFQRLREQARRYDPDVLNALEGVVELAETVVVRTVALEDLASGMTFAEDIRTTTGLLLVSKGQEATPSVCQRLINHSRRTPMPTSVRVFVRGDYDVPERPQAQVAASQRS